MIKDWSRVSETLGSIPITDKTGRKGVRRRERRERRWRKGNFSQGTDLKKGIQ